MILEDLFSKETLSNSLILEAKSLASTAWVNQGNKTFKTVVLPHDAQLSPIYSFELVYRKDYKYPLIVFGGNQSKVKPEIGSQMGSYGGVLTTKDGREWTSLPLEKTGLYAPGEIRDIVTINSEGGRKLIVIRNDDKALEFEILEE